MSKRQRTQSQHTSSVLTDLTNTQHIYATPATTKTKSNYPSTPYSYDLLCSICTQPYIQPLILSCQHNICTQCCIQWSAVCHKNTKERDINNSISVIGLQQHQQYLECTILTEKDNIDALSGIDTRELCSVCLMEDDLDNPLICCDGCDTWIHTTCYGITTLPATDQAWYCDSCTANNNKYKQRTCVVCPNTYDTAYKRTDNNKWIHVSCACWIPGPVFNNEYTKQYVTDINTIHNDRYNLKCTLCNIRQGACIQCSYSTCTKAYHVPCAMRAGLRFELRSLTDPNTQDEMIFHHNLCHKHYNKSESVTAVNQHGTEFDIWRDIEKQQKKQQSSNLIDISCPTCRCTTTVDTNSSTLGLSVNLQLENEILKRNEQLRQLQMTATINKYEAEIKQLTSNKKLRSTLNSVRSYRHTIHTDTTDIIQIDDMNSVATPARRKPSISHITPQHQNINKINITQLLNIIRTYDCTHCDISRKQNMSYCTDCSTMYCEYCYNSLHSKATRTNQYYNHTAELFDSLHSYIQYIFNNNNIRLNADKIDTLLNELVQLNESIVVRKASLLEFTKRKFATLKQSIIDAETKVHQQINDLANNDSNEISSIFTYLQTQTHDSTHTLNVDDTIVSLITELPDDILNENVETCSSLTNEQKQMQLDMLCHAYKLQTQNVTNALENVVLQYNGSNED